MPETDTSWLEKRFPEVLQRFSKEIVAVRSFRGDELIEITPAGLLPLCRFFKSEAGIRFDVLMDLFAMDYLNFVPETPERFAVVYNLFSSSTSGRLFLKCWLPESAPVVDSLCQEFAAANWFEREAWDLFGIRFQGQPGLTRILCHHEFVGHPLRKDYPADGYQRLRSMASSGELS